VDGGDERDVDGGDERDVDGGDERDVDGGDERDVDGGDERDVDGEGDGITGSGMGARALSAFLDLTRVRWMSAKLCMCFLTRSSTLEVSFSRHPSISCTSLLNLSTIRRNLAISSVCFLRFSTDSRSVFWNAFIIAENASVEFEALSQNDLIVGCSIVKSNLNLQFL
jgi:hypothetical protein